METNAKTIRTKFKIRYTIASTTGTVIRQAEETVEGINREVAKLVLIAQLHKQYGCPELDIRIA